MLTCSRGRDNLLRHRFVSFAAVDSFVGFAERAEVDLDGPDHLEGDTALFLARLAADGTQDADLCEHLVETGGGPGLGGVVHGSVVALILERSEAAVEKNRIADLLREPRTPSETCENA